MRDTETVGRGRLGVLDWVILALLFVLIFGGGTWYLLRQRGRSGEERTVYYTVRIYDVERTLASEERLDALIPRGCAVFSENGTARLGFAESASILSKRVAGVRDGEVVFAISPDLVDIDVRVRCTCVWREGDGLRADDVRIAAGESGTFRFGGFYAARATVISVDTEGRE